MTSNRDPSNSYPSRKNASSIPQHIMFPAGPNDLITDATQPVHVPNSQSSTDEIRIIAPEPSGKIHVHFFAGKRPKTRSIGRTIFWQIVLVGVILGTLVTSLRAISPSASAAGSAFQAGVKIDHNLRIVDQVPTFIQIDPTIGYLSQQQYQTYSPADCSAAATSEVMTAWNDPTGDIGHVIADMGDALSPSDGLISKAAFTRVAQQEHFQVTITNSITIAQLASIVRDFGMPVIVGVRDSSGGYYRYFAPGHFLVVTGADSNGFFIVDSSTYFVHYLPTATFLSLWDFPRAVIYYPEGYTLQMPTSK